MFSHSFRQSSQLNTSKVIDRKSSILWIIHWKDILITFLHTFFCKSTFEFLHSQQFIDFLEENLDENT